MGNTEKGDNVSRHRPERNEILLGIVILVVGALLEYIDEVALSTNAASGPDVFPPWISQWDTSLLLSINPALLNPIFNTIFGLITHLGSTFAMVVIGVALYWLGYRKEAVLIFATVVIGTIVLGPLKVIFNRPRPYATLSSVTPIAYETGPSFPSGHTERVFALAAVVPSRRSLKVLFLYLLAIAVAFSRVYVGVHYPLDAIVGAIIGLVVGKVTLRWQARILELASRLTRFLGFQKEPA